MKTSRCHSPILCRPEIVDLRVDFARYNGVKAPVAVTVSTQIRLDALATLRRLGFPQEDAQGQLDTSLGLAIQQSLRKR